MKIAGIILMLFFISNDSYSCMCIPRFNEPFGHMIKRYDFIAHVKVLSVRSYQETANIQLENEDYARIEVIQLFKGEKADSVLVWGIGTSCDIGMRSGQEWIVFGNGIPGKYTTGACSGSYNTNSVWQADLPFFLTTQFRLQKYFNLHTPSLENGIHKTYFPDKRIKNSFRVENNQLEGAFYYLSDRGDHYLYHFTNGQMSGDAFEVNPKQHWMAISRYNKGIQMERQEFFYDESINYDPGNSLMELIDLVKKSDKKLLRHQLVTPEKSIISKEWSTDGWLHTILQRDSLGEIQYETGYFENGNISKSIVVDPLTKIRIELGYYESGNLERKLTRYPDKKEVFLYFDISGSLKQEVIRQDGNIISTKDY